MPKITWLSCLLLLVTGTLSQAQGPGEARDEAKFNVSDRLATPQWVRTDANQTLKGMVEVPVVDGVRRGDLARLALIPIHANATGETIRGTTRLDGSFTLENVDFGTYAMVVHSQDVLATYTLHVLPSSRLSRNKSATTGSTRPASFQPAAASSDDLRVYAAPTNNAFVMRRAANYLPMGSVKPYPIHRFTIDPLQARDRSKERQVYAANDGSLKGRLLLPPASDGTSPPVIGMNVLLVRGKEVLASQVVGADGRFKVDELPLGDYGLVAAGTSGFASVGFEFLEERAAMRSSGNDFRYVSLNQPAGDEDIVIEIVPAFALDQVMDEFNQDDSSEDDSVGPGVQLNEFGWPVDPNAVPGSGITGTTGTGPGSGTGVGAGGGGGGAGGGLGGLGSLAALGAGAAAIAASDGGSNVASPAIP
ncbi:MAG: hypothetical protein R3C05_23515 [Pirellulaceae bacterium]